jgi:murein DD-endopeptidase MepM/ murein hydrolase activator NlpD
LQNDTPLRAIAIALLALLMHAETALAQKLFKYQDANGVWVYTDRQPGPGQEYEESELESTFEAAEVRLYQRAVPQGIAFVARNTYFAPVQISFRLSRLDNVAAGVPRTGLMMLAPRSDTELAVVGKADGGAAMSFESQFRYLPGDPQAEHAPAQPYRLPFAVASSFEVSQAFPDRITHLDPSSEHAVDFVMPVGTPVYAAREGTVIEVASDFFGSGFDPEVDGPRANVVRVLHDDGTMSLYAHLNWNSIRVTPGERIARGHYVADSGNTGFSSGPHLHFVVQRNSGGAIVSVPFDFAGAAGRAITPRRGDLLTAQ